MTNQYLDLLIEIVNLADVALEENPCGCGGAEWCESCMQVASLASEARNTLRHYECRTPYVRKVVALAA